MKLTNRQKEWFAWILVTVAVFAAATFFGVKYPVPPAPADDPVVALGTTHFTNLQAADITATDDMTCTDDMVVSGDMTVSGTASWGCSTSTIENDLVLTGELRANTGVFTTTLDVDGTATINSLDVDAGSITLQNDETIANSTDGLISLGGGTVFNSTTITVTDGQHITPTTYTGYRLNAAGAVTITLAACSSDFQLLALYGEDNQTITVADSNIRTNDGGVQAIGQYDVITWMCINSEWMEISESNNS